MVRFELKDGAGLVGLVAVLDRGLLARQTTVLAFRSWVEAKAAYDRVDEWWVRYDGTCAKTPLGRMSGPGKEGNSFRFVTAAGAAVVFKPAAEVSVGGRREATFLVLVEPDLFDPADLARLTGEYPSPPPADAPTPAFSPWVGSGPVPTSAASESPDRPPTWEDLGEMLKTAPVGDALLHSSPDLPPQLQPEYRLRIRAGEWDEVEATGPTPEGVIEIIKAAPL